MREQRQLAAVWWILAVMALTLSAAPAVAQTQESGVSITTLAGVAIAPGPHPATGIAVGLRPQPGPISLEFEYSRSRSGVVGGEPGILTLAGNILVQPSRQRSRFQFYGTFGVGLYALPSGHDVSEPESARNIGGGTKIALAGPLKLRMDYRAFLLARLPGETHSNEHRVYVGIVAGF